MKKIGMTRKVSVTLEEEIWQKLEDYCYVNDCSMSKAIRDMMYMEEVQVHLNRYDAILAKMGEENER